MRNAKEQNGAMKGKQCQIRGFPRPYRMGRGSHIENQYSIEHQDIWATEVDLNLCALCPMNVTAGQEHLKEKV